VSLRLLDASSDEPGGYVGQAAFQDGTSYRLLAGAS